MNELVKYEEARRALQAAYSIDEVKNIRDKMEGLRAYARQANDVEMQNWAAEIRLRAERRAGEMLKEMKERGERKGAGQPKKETSLPTTILSDLGITRDQSSKWQKIASIPEEHFETMMTAAKDAGMEITTRAALQEARDQVLRRKRLELNHIKRFNVRTLKRTYDVIVLDPPWPVDSTFQSAKLSPTVKTGLPGGKLNPYQPMSVDDIEREWDEKLPKLMEPDCHLFLWCPMSMPGLSLISYWDVELYCTMVWHKRTGIQPVGGPKYNLEFVYYAKRGNPTFFGHTEFPACFEGRSGAHSEKPEEFYEMVRRVTAGRRLDVYNRRPIAGFDGWGDQSPYNDMSAVERRRVMRAQSCEEIKDLPGAKLLDSPDVHRTGRPGRNHRII